MCVCASVVSFAPFSTLYAHYTTLWYFGGRWHKTAPHNAMQRQAIT